jgi:hypothetical protein
VQSGRFISSHPAAKLNPIQVPINATDCLGQLRLKALIALIAAILISGCSSVGDVTLTTAKNLLPAWATPEPKPTNPDLAYLRIQISGRSALLVLGEIDNHPQGPIESWYSAEAEVLKLQNGRIVGSGGLTTNWVHVHIEPFAQGYERTRDVMPGYRFGLRDRFLIRPLAKPPSEMKASGTLTKEKLEALQWFEEVPVTASVTGRVIIGFEPREGFTKQAKVGFQCLDDGLCIRWERL